MKKGDIIIASLPMIHGTYKKRPALIINSFPPYNDFLLCGISSQLHQNIKEAAYLLSANESYFKETGLSKSSIIRLNYLVMIPQTLIEGRIGSVPDSIYKEILNRLIELIRN